MDKHVSTICGYLCITMIAIWLVAGLLFRPILGFWGEYAFALFDAGLVSWGALIIGVDLLLILGGSITIVIGVFRRKARLIGILSILIALAWGSLMYYSYMDYYGGSIILDSVFAIAPIGTVLVAVMALNPRLTKYPITETILIVFAFVGLLLSVPWIPGVDLLPDCGYLLFLLPIAIALSSSEQGWLGKRLAKKRPILSSGQGQPQVKASADDLASLYELVALGALSKEEFDDYKRRTL